MQREIRSHQQHQQQPLWSLAGGGSSCRSGVQCNVHLLEVRAAVEAVLAAFLLALHVQSAHSCHIQIVDTLQILLDLRL